MHDSAMQFSATRGSRPQKLAYKVPEAAELVGITPRQMWSYVAQGRIESLKIGASRRISHQALVDFMDRHRTQARPIAS